MICIYALYRILMIYSLFAGISLFAGVSNRLIPLLVAFSLCTPCNLHLSLAFKRMEGKNGGSQIWEGVQVNMHKLVLLFLLAGVLYALPSKYFSQNISMCIRIHVCANAWWWGQISTEKGVPLPLNGPKSEFLLQTVFFCYQFLPIYLLIGKEGYPPPP